MKLINLKNLCFLSLVSMISGVLFYSLTSCDGNFMTSQDPYTFVIEEENETIHKDSIPGIKEGKLYLEMPLLTKDYSGHIEWHGVEINKILKDLFNYLQDEKNYELIDFYVIFREQCEDKYGQSFNRYKEGHIAYIKVSEVKKFKNYRSFNNHYHIEKNIETIAFEEQHTSYVKNPSVIQNLNDTIATQQIDDKENLYILTQDSIQ